MSLIVFSILLYQLKRKMREQQETTTRNNNKKPYKQHSFFSSYVFLVSDI